MLVVVIINQNVFTVMHVFFTVTNIPFRHEFFLYIIFVIIQHKLCNLKWRCSSASITQFSYLPTANYRFGIFQTFITSGHCIVDLPTANYTFGIFQTFITSGHCVVDLPTAYYPFGIFQTFITNGHCVADLPTSNYHFGTKFFIEIAWCQMKGKFNK